MELPRTMSPVAVISDIHGNQPALEAVLDDIRALGISTIFCLGDVTGYGPDVNECCDLIRAQCAVNLLGNHDAAVLGDIPISLFNTQAADAIRYARAVMTPRNTVYLSRLPLTVCTARLCLAHSTPWQPNRWHYLQAGNLEENLRFLASSIGLVGHSHLLGAYLWSDADERWAYLPGTADSEEVAIGHRGGIVVAGSVGQPRDGDPRASYVVLDLERARLRFRRCTYPVALAQRRIVEAGLPAVLAARLAVGR